MARRTRSFLFDNISKRLVQNTNKTAKEINTRKAANTTANTDILTKAEVETVISNTSIATLSDTTVANVANEQVLQYNANTGKWENETLTLVSSVDGLSDTNLTSLSNGDYLVYNSSGSEWINRSLDLSSYVTDTEIADYSNTAQMNTAIAASNTLMTTYVDDQVANVSVDLSSYSTTTQMNTAIAASNTAMKSYVDAEVAGIVNSAPAALDTLNELAAALGDDPDFATTVSTNIGTKLAKSSNLSDLTNAATARTNLGLGTAATTASTDYATSAQGTKADTAHGWGNHASAGYGTSNFSGAYADLTGKPSLFSGSYNDLSNKPTIPTNNNQLTNGAGYTTTTAQELSRTGLSSSDDLGSGSSAPLSSGWYGWGSSQPSNSPDNYALMWQLNDGGQAQQWVMAYGGAANSVDLYGRRRTGGTWDTTWTKFWNSTDFSSTNVSNWNTAYGWGNHASAGYSTFSGSYNDLSNKPTIPTNNNQLTNGAGYITSSSLSGYQPRTLQQSSRNLVFATGSTGAGGIFLEKSNGSPLIQLYSDGTNYGFLWGEWGGWDIKKADGGPLYIDIGGTLREVYHTGNLPTIPTNNNQLTNGAGYITNSGGTTAATASTVAKRNGSGDINARLFRSSYGNQSTISGAIAYRVNTSDNYIRFCSDGAAIRSFIGAGTSNFNGAYSSLSGRPSLGGGTPYLDLSTANYGTVKVDDDRGVTWAGYTIRDDWSLMSDGASNFGIYNDTDNEWSVLCRRNADTEIMYNGNAMLETTSAGVQINGTIDCTSQFAYTARNYGHGIFGVYSSTRYQHVWSMGTAYKTNASGTSYGNMYGLTYTHTNVGTGSNQSISGLSHQLQHRTNGTLTAAIGSGIWTSGNVTAYSDIAVKENIVKIDNAIDKVKQINGYTYDRIDIKKQNEDLGEDIPTRQAGVIAQEIEKVLPEVVSGDDGNKAVAYGNVVALLIEAIKEQQQQIEELKEIIDGSHI